MRRITNRDEIVYLLCCFIPKKKTELPYLIYRKYTRALVDTIKNLELDGRVELFSPNELNETLKERLGIINIRRIHKNTRFVYSKPGPLLDSIIIELEGKGVELYEYEKKQLIKLINSDEFRKFAENNIKKYINNNKKIIQDYPSDFKFIKYALSSHCITIYDCKEYLKDRIFSNIEEMKKNIIKILKQKNAIPNVFEFTIKLDDVLLTKLSQLSEQKNAEVKLDFERSLL